MGIPKKPKTDKDVHNFILDFVRYNDIIYTYNAWTNKYNIKYTVF